MIGVGTSKEPRLQAIGNYELLEKIAEGGMGSIYKGRHLKTGQLVAIKVMPAQTASNPTLVKRFEQEFRAASRLNHPNIVRALDYGDTGSTPYLVMEYIDGKSLGQLLEEEGKLPEKEAIRIINQVAQGLHRAHKQNLVHRDVKPDNILISKDGVAKLADLGLVKETETDLNLTKTGRGLGTPHFMAPEQFRDAKNADKLCDIYSLGATLYQMVTGELPFKSNGPLDAWMKKIQNELTPPRKLVPALSERLDWAILRAMSADRNMRPTSCREFVEDLVGHSTRRTGSQETPTAAQEVWFLVYKDEAGATHTVRGTSSAIRRSLRDGVLGDAGNIRASRSKAGPFEQLRGYPEFRDLVLAPAPVSAAAATATGSRGTPAADGAAAAVSPSQANMSSPNLPASRNANRPAPVPRIALGGSSESAPGSYEWLKWLFLLALAVGSALAAFYFIPLPR